LKEKKKRNIKKTVLITVSIILAVILVLATAGYIIIDKAFSMLAESIYPSSESHYETTLDENKSSGTLDDGVANEEQPVETGKDEGIGKPQMPNDSLAQVQKKFGIGGSMNFSDETVKKFEKSVSMSDKLAVLAIISRGLSTQDYQRLLAMTSGGITRSEVSQAFSILKNGLKSGDKDKIYEYYQKYSYLLEGN
jgi:hypothetical protein